jgi:tripartite-type tricarboxylate transporter receptor subunit TctC
VNRHRKNIAMTIVVAVVPIVVSSLAQSQAFPSKPIRLIVPFAPGGSTDIVGRVIGAKLSESVGQQIIIDNKPGANTIIGTEIAAKSLPDGYTLVIATSSHSSNPSMYKKLPYDTVRDFASVIYVGSTPNVIAVNPSLPARSLKAMLDLSRSKTAQLDFATAGHGTTQHFTGELLNQLAKTRMVHVGYKGGGPATIDVIAGQVAILISGLPPAMPFVKSGKLYPIAVTSLRRSPILPEVPTVAESGFPGFDTSFWYAILAPAGTPKPTVGRLNDAINATLKVQSVREQLMSQGVDIAGGTSEDLDNFLKQDTDKWAKLIRASNIQLLD